MGSSEHNEMKILVLGGGGREHALVWKLGQSPSVEKIWCAPGNGGIENDADCLPLDLGDVNAAADLAEKLRADLTIVGPELPLVRGVADEFSGRGLSLLGPMQKAAQLEGSKIFAKQFMQRHRIPTAAVYGLFDSAADAHAGVRSARKPVVIKADGLCAGKGVLVTSSVEEADEFIDRAMTRGEFGDAGKRVVIEEALAGDELSYIILTDGRDFVAMAPTRDYKRAYDGDKGPNTGGMGAYSTEDILAPELEGRIMENVVRPTLHGLVDDTLPYRGFLYFGLMLTPDGPKVLEYNCRLGDPETQAMMLRAEFELAEACRRAATGELRGFAANWSPRPSTYVVMASEGYPASPKTGVRIRGLERTGTNSGAAVFHAGTRRDGMNYYTSGGRILGVGSTGPTLADARSNCYDMISKIEIQGAFYRRDIANVGVKRGIAVSNGSR